jgi:DNA primase
MIAATELFEENEMQDMNYEDNDFNDLLRSAELEVDQMPENPETELPPPEDLTPEVVAPEHEQNNPASTIEVITSLIDSLTGDALQDLATLKDDIAPRIAATDGLTEDLLITRVKGKTGISKGVIRAEIQAARQNIEKITVMPENSIEEKLNDEIVARAEALKKDPFLFRHIIEAVGKLGVAGERKTIGTIIVVIASRLIPKGFNSSEALALKIWGPYGIGKSRTVFACLELCPQDSYYAITSGSPKSLYNMTGKLKHKVLVLTEAFAMDETSGGDSNFSFSVRSVVSEGNLIYQYTAYDENGKRVTIQNKVEGPMALLTTTTKENLEPQLEDRLLSIRPDTSAKQTSDILMISAQEAAGSENRMAGEEVKTWQYFQKTLEPLNVVIPFAKEIAKHISQNQALPTSARRAFNKVRSAIKALALFHQHQREHDEQGRVIAEIRDYSIIYQLLDDSFRENIGQGKEYTDPRVKVIEKHGPITLKDLSRMEKVSVPTLTEWVAQRTQKGLLVWCDERGNPFSDDASTNKAKHSGKAFIRLAYPCGLPTPYQLTGDPRWDEGGELYRMYDLGLSEQREHEEIVVPEKTQDKSVNDLWEQALTVREVSHENEDNADRVFGWKGDGGEEKNDSQIPEDTTSRFNEVSQEILKEFSGFLKRGEAENFRGEQNLNQGGILKWK